MVSQNLAALLGFYYTRSAADGLYGFPVGLSDLSQAMGYYYTNASSPNPYVSTQTANQYALPGASINLTLASNTFVDPRGAALTYTAMQSNGKALPSWLSFNAKTMTFKGIEPNPASPVTVVVTATDSLGLSASETFQFITPSVPVLQTQTTTQYFGTGTAIKVALPASTFTDPQGSKLTYTATQANGQPLANWLTFNASTLTFTGSAPSAATSVSIKLTAADMYGLSASETFTLGIVGAPILGTPTANQTWIAGKAVTLTLPGNLFTDPQSSPLTYSATQANGTALPSWLGFNTKTETFTGTAPAGFYGTLGLKVTAAIQGDELRVTGKNRDDLQAVIAAVRGHDFKVALSFGNFRD